MEIPHREVLRTFEIPYPLRIDRADQPKNEEVGVDKDAFAPMLFY